MTDKDLKRLRRDELLEMLIAQSKRTDQLQAELDAARAQLASRAIVLEEAGSIAAIGQNILCIIPIGICSWNSTISSGALLLKNTFI